MHHTCKWPDIHSGNRTDKTDRFPPAGHARWFFGITESETTPPGVPSSAVFAAGHGGVAHSGNRLVNKTHDPLERGMIWARRSKLVSAWRISCKDEAESAGRAIRIMSQPGFIWGNKGRIASRKRRLALFRCTAPPTDRPAVTPTRTLGASLACTTNTTNGWA
jgi:hypothetical protein